MKTPGVINVVVEATKNGKILHTVTSIRHLTIDVGINQLRALT